MEFVNYQKLDFGFYSPMEIVDKLLTLTSISEVNLWKDWLSNISFTDTTAWKYQIDIKGVSLVFTSSDKKSPPYQGIRIGHKSVLDSKKGIHPLVQIINRQKDLSNFSVVDVTGGLLNDTYLLLSSGQEVWTFEANPLICLLIMVHQCLRTRNDKNKFHFIPGSFSLDKCSSLINKNNKKIAIYDPMFFAKEHKSLSSSSMQLLYQLEKEFPLEDLTFIHWESWRSYFDLLIVKRHDKAKFLFEEKPTYQLPGKIIRWDVYSRR